MDKGNTPRRSSWTFGAAPLDMGDERVLAASVAISTTLLQIDHLGAR